MIPHRVELWLLDRLAGSPLPAHWLYPPAPPPVETLPARRGRLQLEIVSHCWRYSRLLAYQLTSLIDHPVHDIDVTMTVFHAREDTATCRLLELVAGHSPRNIRWHWWPLAPSALFRRSIGRNLAARQSSADWVWFTDCDLVFGAGCLDGLAAALQGRRDRLVYPRSEAKTDVYTDDDVVERNELDAPVLLRAPADRFRPRTVTRATGPLQITHGDVARNLGYCANVRAYQRPARHFCKAVEDRCFRWLLATDGTPIDVPGVCRIQHAHKGRYGEPGRLAALRRRIREAQHRRREGRVVDGT